MDDIISLPHSWIDRQKKAKLKYFIPDWNDWVDPEYDFLTDTPSARPGRWSNQVYAHQLYSEPSYDGLLVSRAVSEKGKRNFEQILEMGVHNFLRVPDSFPVMGDCGAFDYVDKDIPPYSTDDVIHYYTQLGFDYGVSVDHLILKATDEKRKFRYDLTINNAEAFLEAHGKENFRWQPIGAVQGWDPESYAQAAGKYVQMGYRYLALGGLVRSQTSHVLEVVQCVRDVIPKDIKLHIFGVARIDALQAFVELGVDSVDSASYLRNAWLGSTKNYLSPKGWYPAIRVPQTTASFRAKKVVDEGKATIADLIELERNCLNGLRDHGNRKGRSLESLLDNLEQYDTLIAGDRMGTRDRLGLTLDSRPWESCSCAICKQVGIEVVIFRGNNRNRRRGFHNTCIFYQLLDRMQKGEDIGWLKNSQVAGQQD